MSCSDFFYDVPNSLEENGTNSEQKWTQIQINTFTHDCKKACRLFHLRCRFPRFIPVIFFTRIERMFMIHFAGVSWKDWKAKEGECEEKCDGAAGPFYIVRECQDERCSCKGHKTTKETKECTKYCSSTDSTGRMK